MTKSIEELRRMEVCSYLLPPPGDEIVRELISEILELHEFYQIDDNFSPNPDKPIIKS